MLKTFAVSFGGSVNIQVVGIGGGNYCDPIIALVVVAYTLPVPLKAVTAKVVPGMMV